MLTTFKMIQSNGEGFINLYVAVFIAQVVLLHPKP